MAFLGILQALDSDLNRVIEINTQRLLKSSSVAVNLLVERRMV